MESSTYVTFADDAIYTIFFTTYEYIPKGGLLKVEMPEGIEVKGDASGTFSSTATGL